jgi:SWI/SNF-related matrix-associated actin-dependent regulator 1 of chromatin subfamily A
MTFKLRETTELLPHQVTAVEQFVDKKAFGIFDEPGLGKTLEFLASVCQIKGRALAVVPPFLMNTWHTDIEKHTYLEVGKDIDLVSYTMLGKRINSFKDYVAVAADEGHYLKNLDAQRTSKFHAYLAKDRPEFFTYMTGTPIKGRVHEIYSFLCLIAQYPHVSPKITVKYNSYYKFCMRFCNVTERTIYGRSIMQFSGMKNIDELKEYLKPWTIRRLAKDYLNLPEMQNQMITANYKDDPELQAQFTAFTDGSIKGGDIVAKKNSAVAKAHFTAEYVSSQLEAGVSPVLVFSDHRDPVSLIERELSTNWRAASIMGGDSADKRNDIVGRFQNGQLDVLIATVGSSSTGLTLTKSNLVVFNDVPWVPSDLVQARKRIHRISQERECRCIYIVGSKVDDYIIRTIRSKEKVITALVDS